MVARARKSDENFKDYRENLKYEAAKLKVRLSKLYAAASPSSKLMQASKRFLSLFNNDPVNLAPVPLSAKDRAKLRSSRKAQRVARRTQRR
jgi:hypothetical protein